MPIIKTPQQRVATKQRPVLRKALVTLRDRCPPLLVAKTLWSVLSNDEKSSFRLLCEGADVDCEDRAKVAVAEALAVDAASSSQEATGSRAVLARASKKVFRSRRAAEGALGVAFGRRVWRRREQNPRSKGGRPNIKNKAETKVEVRKYLDQNSTLNSHYIKIAGQMTQCHSLQRSKRKLWMLSPEMQKLMSLSTWTRHLRMHHRQYVKYKKKVDVCGICHKYDVVTVPRVKRELDEARNLLCSQSPTYFDNLDRFWAGMKASGKTDPAIGPQFADICFAAKKTISVPKP